MMSSGPRHHFYTRPWAHVIFLVLFVAGPVVLGVWLETDPTVSPGSGWLAGLMMLGIGQLVYLPLFWYQRLIVSADGIRVRAPFVSLMVPWDNVERLHRGRGDHAGLVTKAPLSAQALDRWGNFSRGTYGWRLDDMEQAWDSENRYLLLAPFHHAVHRRTLQREITRYNATLPGLDDGEELVPAAERAATMRSVVLILGLTAAWTVVALMTLRKLFPDINGEVNWKLPVLLYAGMSLQSAAFAAASWIRRRRYWTFINGAMACLMALLAISVWHSSARR